MNKCKCGNHKYQYDEHCIDCKSAEMKDRVYLYCYEKDNSTFEYRLKAVQDITNWTHNEVTELIAIQEEMGRTTKIERIRG